MANFFFKICAAVAYVVTRFWWIPWSNFRWRRALRQACATLQEDKAVTTNEIKDLAAKLMKRFTWTNDRLDQLFDAILPPSQAYKNYLHGKLTDDCDGFHSLLYHCLKQSGRECYLMTVNAFGAGHCVILLHNTGFWHVIDYKHVYDGCDTAKEAVEKYFDVFQDVYNSRSRVFFHSYCQYDYISGKFVFTKKKEVETNNVEDV